ncbi:MAG: hypothetical protein MPW13_02800 [Candidatus Manganitrophus sp.]|nr:hypothetical protein [Candidatus Manganitrophus sp.]
MKKRKTDDNRKLYKGHLQKHFALDDVAEAQKATIMKSVPTS